MPVLPWLGTGLSPVFQWLVVPAVAFAIAGIRANAVQHTDPQRLLDRGQGPA
jgi:hypothetical protein